MHSIFNQELLPSRVSLKSEQGRGVLFVTDINGIIRTYTSAVRTFVHAACKEQLGKDFSTFSPEIYTY
jgi:hypothetical protein